MCVSACACSYGQERAVETRGEPRIPLTLFFEIGSLTSLELTKQVRLALPGIPRIHLSLPLQGWDYRCEPSCLAFSVCSGG